jgi:hypothetical protein
MGERSGQTVREALKGEMWAQRLGVDPDLPVETLKRRLLWGERVERCFQPHDRGWVDTNGVDGGWRSATSLLTWLTREEA